MDELIKKFLESNNIMHTLHSHPAVFTCEEAEIHCKDVPGLACKNLFLQDKKKRHFFLVSLPAKKRLNLKSLEEELEVRPLKFASEATLLKLLGLTPGSVSPLGLLNDSERKVQLLIDQELWNAKIVSFHPNINTETLEFSQEAFHKLAALLREDLRVLQL